MDIGLITQLGIAGLATYFMYEQTKRNERRIDERDATSRKFEQEVRTDILKALHSSTEAVKTSSKTIEANGALMERVLRFLEK